MWELSLISYENECVLVLVFSWSRVYSISGLLCSIFSFVVTGEIRCYCDAPHCVATGYMCKSELNACFTRTLDPQSTKSLLSHGCYDPLLNSGKTCHPESTYDTVHGSTLQCCHEDMCNYRGLQDLAYRGSEIHGTSLL